MRIHKRSLSGYALVTALVFLTILTLLGVSAVGRVTLQERMASNLREKGRADEAANAALRAGELWVFGALDYPKPAAAAPTGADPMPAVWGGGVPTALLGVDYVNDRFWDGNAGTVNVDPQALNQFASGTQGGVAGTPQYFLEESVAASLGSSLTPASQGGSRTDAKIYFYRVTGRGVGGNTTAISVHQSVYGRVY